MDTAIEIQPDTANLRINVGADGVWLHFKSSDGKFASYNMAHVYEKLGAQLGRECLRQWILDRQAQAKSIRSLERKS